MTATVAFKQKTADPFERVAPLLPAFAERAAEHDASDAFVAGNYALLKEARLFSAGVPVEFGGDGLDAAGLGRLLTMIAKACSSTALAFAMHTHTSAVLAWRWRNQKAPVDAMLKRIADEQIVLITTGGSDWLESSGTAKKVEGGFEIDGVKGFASGVPAGTLLNTSAVYDDPANGPTVLHFMVPLNAKGVRIEPTWRAMGMRATASHVVHIEGYVVPEAAVSVRRPKGKWHPLFHTISMIALPIIYSVYYGVAEAARDAAIATAKKKPATPQLVDLVGEMETELAAARMALADMMANTSSMPGPETTNRTFLGRVNFVRAALAASERAMEVTNAAGFMRAHPVERLFRDIQGARFHPLPTRPQRDLAGRLALGLDIDGRWVAE